MRSWPVVSGRVLGARLPVVLAAGLVAALAGCATVPSGGAPQRVSGGSGQAQAFVQPLPPPSPGASWLPQEVVFGFLHASASFATDPAAARQYLVPGSLRRNWQPQGVTVLGSPRALSVGYYPRSARVQPSAQGGPAVFAVVKFVGPRLATVSPTGQYQYQSGSPVYQFRLTDVKGVWLINGLPRELLLLRSDFEEVYQPRNLYFLSPEGFLVPDPVFMPVRVGAGALSSGLATSLVSGLLSDNGGWLSGATRTAFPAGTKLIGPVTISDGTADVDLSSAAAAGEIPLMVEQIAETLRSSAYSPPLAHSVRLSIDNKPQNPGALPGPLVPPVANPSVPVYFYDAGGVSTLTAKPGQTSVVLRSAQIGQAPITATAATRPEQASSEQLAVAVAAGNGCAVFIGSPGSTAAYRAYALSDSGGPCTSLSWDGDGNLWAVAGSRIWVLQPGRQPAAVTPPALPGTSDTGSRILALRMAPDGVRAALLVRSAGGTRLLLAAVSYRTHGASFGTAVTIGSDLSGAAALSWYSPYDLAVLAGTGIYEVPLSGGASQLLGPAPSGARWLSTNGSEFVVGTAGNKIYESASPDGKWMWFASGTAPVYPG